MQWLFWFLLFVHHSNDLCSIIQGAASSAQYKSWTPCTCSQVVASKIELGVKMILFCVVWNSRENAVSALPACCSIELCEGQTGWLVLGVCASLRENSDAGVVGVGVSSNLHSGCLVDYIFFYSFWYFCSTQNSHPGSELVRGLHWTL